MSGPETTSTSGYSSQTSRLSPETPVAESSQNNQNVSQPGQGNVRNSGGWMESVPSGSYETAQQNSSSPDASGSSAGPLMSVEELMSSQSPYVNYSPDGDDQGLSGDDFEDASYVDGDASYGPEYIGDERNYSVSSPPDDHEGSSEEPLMSPLSDQDVSGVNYSEDPAYVSRTEESRLSSEPPLASFAEDDGVSGVNYSEDPAYVSLPEEDRLYSEEPIMSVSDDYYTEEINYSEDTSFVPATGGDPEPDLPSAEEVNATIFRLQFLVTAREQQAANPANTDFVDPLPEVSTDDLNKMLQQAWNMRFDIEVNDQWQEYFLENAYMESPEERQRLKPDFLEKVLIPQLESEQRRRSPFGDRVTMFNPNDIFGLGRNNDDPIEQLLAPTSQFRIRSTEVRTHPADATRVAAPPSMRYNTPEVVILDENFHTRNNQNNISALVDARDVQTPIPGGLDIWNPAHNVQLVDPRPVANISDSHLHSVLDGSKDMLFAGRTIQLQEEVQQEWGDYAWEHGIEGDGNSEQQAAFFAQSEAAMQFEFNNQQLQNERKNWDSASVEREVAISLGVLSNDGDVSTLSEDQRDFMEPIIEQVRDVGGTNPHVQLVNTFLKTEGGELQKNPLLLVQDGNKDWQIIDATGRVYEDTEDYLDNHRLTEDGTLIMPSRLARFNGGWIPESGVGSNGHVELSRLQVEAHSDMNTGDWIVAGGTTVATILSFTPAAPIAAPLAIAGGAYLGGRSAYRLYDMSAHGQSLWSAQGALEGVSVVTSALPMASAGLRTVGLFRAGMTTTAALRVGTGAVNFTGRFATPYAGTAAMVMQDGSRVFRIAQGTDVAGMVIGTPLMVYEGYNLGQTGYHIALNWDEMENEQLYAALNSLAGFATGVYGTGVSARAYMNSRRMVDHHNLPLTTLDNGNRMPPIGGEQILSVRDIEGQGIRVPAELQIAVPPAGEEGLGTPVWTVKIDDVEGTSFQIETGDASTWDMSPTMAMAGGDDASRSSGTGGTDGNNGPIRTPQEAGAEAAGTPVPPKESGEHETVSAGSEASSSRQAMAGDGVVAAGGDDGTVQPPKNTGTEETGSTVPPKDGDNAEAVAATRASGSSEGEPRIILSADNPFEQLNHSDRLGITGDQISKLSGEQVAKWPAEIFGDLTKDQSAALTREHFSAMTDEQFHELRLYNLSDEQLGWVPDSIVRNIPVERLNRYPVGRLQALLNGRAEILTPQQQKGINPELLRAAIPDDIRRSQVALERINAGIEQGTPVTEISVQLLNSLQPEQFAALDRSIIRQLSGEQLSSIWSDHLQVIPVDLIPELPMQEVSPRRLRKLTIEQVEALGRPQLDAMTGEQLAYLRIEKLPPDIIPRVSIEHLSETRFREITTQQQGWLTIEQIGQLRKGQLASLKAGRLSAFSFRQRLAISDQRIEILPAGHQEVLKGSYIETPYGRMNFSDRRPVYTELAGDNYPARLETLRNMPPDQISTVSPRSLREIASIDIPKLSPEQVRQLNFDQIAFLTNDQVHALTPEQLSALDVFQLGALSQEQRGSILPENKSGLTAGQRSVLTMPVLPTEYGPVSVPEIFPSKHNNYSPRSLTGLPKLQASSPLNEVSMLFPGRGIRTLETSQGIENAAHVLMQQEDIVLVTGFNVDKGKPETDGPAGTILLGRMLTELGKNVTYVTEPTNAPVLNKGLESLGLSTDQVVIFQKPDGAGDDWNAVAAAQKIIDDIEPGVVMAVETPARGADNVARNMRGTNVSEFNEPLDAFVLAANNPSDDGHRVPWTIGVGDGGNEVGMGVVSEHVPRALDGSDMASQVPTDILATASVSNWGAEAIAGAMANLEGKPGLLHTPQQLEAVLRATVEAGAVDGVSRLAEPSVDGFSLEAHLGWRSLMAESLDHTQSRIFLGLMDSSNGGLWAGKVLQNQMQELTGLPVQLVIGTDHGRGTYGSLPDKNTIGMATNAVLRPIDRSLSETSSHFTIAMACNTACTGADYNATIRSVVDLLDSTANHMVQHGKEHIVSLSTSPTAGLPKGVPGVNNTDNKGAYASILARRNDAEGRRITEIGASNDANHNLDLARIVNATGNNPTPEQVKIIENAAEHYVRMFPPDATTVYLTCTHYPAIQKYIERAIEARTDWTGGKGPDVINPINAQGEKAYLKLVEQGMGSETGMHQETRHSPPPVVITSAGDSPTEINPATRASVLQDARDILSRDDVRLVGIDQYPDGGSPAADVLANQILHEVFRPTDPNEGTLHVWSQKNKDGEWKPIEAEIRSAELEAYNKLKDDMGDALPQLYDNMLRAINGDGALPTTTPPNEGGGTPPKNGGDGTQSSGDGSGTPPRVPPKDDGDGSPPAGNEKRFGLMREAVRDYGPMTVASLALAHSLSPGELMALNAGSWALRGGLQALKLSAPDLLAPDKYAGRVVEGLNALAFLGNAGWHVTGFSNEAAGHFNQFYTVSDMVGGAQSYRNVLSGRANPQSSILTSIGLGAANLANTGLLFNYSLDAGAVATGTTLMFGGGTAYLTWQHAKAMMAANAGVPLNTNRYHDQAARSIIAAGLLGFSADYFLNQALPTLRAEERERQEETLRQNAADAEGDNGAEAENFSVNPQNSSELSPVNETDIETKETGDGREK